jgi:Protein of unknown function (DUF2924).
LLWAVSARSPQRQLRQIAQELKQTGAAAKRFRPQLKPGTRLIREWQGRTYEVVVLDDGFSLAGHAVPLAVRDRAKDHRRRRGQGRCSSG